MGDKKIFDMGRNQPEDDLSVGVGPATNLCRKMLRSNSTTHIDQRQLELQRKQSLAHLSYIFTVFGSPPQGFGPPRNIPKETIAGPVYGWRWWYVINGVIQSIHYNHYWRPRKASVATCRTMDHEAPAQPCHCGFYAFTNLDDAKKYYESIFSENAGAPIITGRLALWGRVFEHARGYRAQYAYPESFVAFEDNYEIATDIALKFGVPLILMPREIAGDMLPKVEPSRILKVTSEDVGKHIRGVMIDGKPVRQVSEDGIHWRDDV